MPWTTAGGRPTWPIRPIQTDGLVVVGTTGFATAVVEALGPAVTTGVPA